MKKARKTATKTPAKKTLTLKTIKELCAECGYTQTLRGKKCPMCPPCPRCGRKLMQCVCIAGE